MHRGGRAGVQASMSTGVDGHVGFPDVRTDQGHSASTLIQRGLNPCSHSSKLLTYSSESLEPIQSGGASPGGVQDAISLDHYMKLRECVPDGGGGSRPAK